MYVCYVTLVSQGQPLYGQPIMNDLLALVCRITKRGSLTQNLSQPCRHHNTVRHGYGSNNYGLVISPPFVARKQMRSDASAPRWRKSEACKVWMINWCGCCHIQRECYISTSACSSSAAKNSGCLEDQVLISSSSQDPKWLLEVVWSLLLRLNVLIHRVRANLKWIAASKFQEQIVSFNMRALSVSDELHRLPLSSKCKFLIIVWFASFCGAFGKHFLLKYLRSMLVVKWVWGVLMPEGWEKSRSSKHRELKSCYKKCSCEGKHTRHHPVTTTTTDTHQEIQH